VRSFRRRGGLSAWDLRDGVDGLVVGKAGDDLLPGLAAVVGAVDIRMQVVEAEAVDGGVGS